MSTRAVTVFALLLVATFGVASRLLTHGTVVLQANSPDKRWVASCRDFPSFDGPNQRLFVVDARTERETMRLQLFEDMDWCDQIVWSPDARVVGFVVRGERLVIFAPLTGRMTDQQLIPPDGSYPGDFEAVNVQVERNTGITFQSCRRGGSSLTDCVERNMEMTQ